MEKINFYETIVIGLGASGLFFCAAPVDSTDSKGNILVLEKNSKAGVKLLMSGGGQCNFTHQGSIKEFACCYGSKGPQIRQCLYKHNNLKLMDFVRSMGIDVLLREDGKVFPKSLQSRDLLNALLKKCHENRVSVLYDHMVTDVIKQEGGFLVSASGPSRPAKTFSCKNLVIATGGCSYPTTGSDGRMLDILAKSLNIPIITPKPALTPVYISDYPFSAISGVSLANVSMKITYGSQSGDDHVAKSTGRPFFGDLLFTHENLSGPLIINNSRYMNPGNILEFNFVSHLDYSHVVGELKATFHGNSKEIIPYISSKFSLPKSFVEILLAKDGFSRRKMSSLSGHEINLLATRLTKNPYTVHHLCEFSKAMATSGGIDLSAVNLKTMESKQYPGLFFIGEALDVDGDTGGYNIQFAYSSAMAASDFISK